MVNLTLYRVNPRTPQCAYAHRMPWWFPRLVLHWQASELKFTPHVRVVRTTRRACLRHTRRAWQELDATGGNE